MKITAARNTGTHGVASARLLRTLLVAASIASVSLLGGCGDDSSPASGGTSPTPTSAAVNTATSTSLPSFSATLSLPTATATVAPATFTSIPTATATGTPTEPPVTATSTPVRRCRRRQTPSSERTRCLRR